MTRGATHLAAGLIGMALAWAVTAFPLGAARVPTPIAWDATACSAGVYTITSTARGTDRGHAQAFVVTSTDVALPRSSVVQEFPDLPAGTFAVTAIARRTDGRTFESETQIVSVGEYLAAAQAPGASAGRRPASAASRGVARSRRSSGTPDRYAASSAGSVPAPPAAVPSAEPVGRSRRGGSAPASWLDRFLADLRDVADPAGTDWRRIELVDVDADGVVDWVSIELANGGLLNLRVPIR